MAPIKAFGFVSAADYRAFYNFNMFKGKYYRFRRAAFFGIFFIISVFLIAFSFYSHEKAYAIFGGIVLLCVFMFTYLSKLSVRRACNKNKELVRSEHDVEFGKNGFVCLLTYKGEQTARDDYFFDDITAVYETTSAFYFAFDKFSTYIIPKRNIKGEPKALREYLQAILPNEKYILCK